LTATAKSLALALMLVFLVPAPTLVAADQSPQIADTIPAAGPAVGRLIWVAPAQPHGGQRDDFLIPQRLPLQLQPAGVAPSPQPLALGSSSPGPAPGQGIAVSGTGADGTSLQLTHSFTSAPVLVGSPVEATVSVENPSNRNLHNLTLEIYFVLEDSDLLSAPSQCRQQLSLSLQIVLACELGSFAAGETRTFSYSVQPLAAAQVLFASVLIDQLRVDDVVNIVPDVRKDSDGDGVSDFNEKLLATDPLDPISVDDGITVIDVMVLYTPASRELYPFGVAPRINELISVANQVYADSGVGISLRPVYQGLIDIDDTLSMDALIDALLTRKQESLRVIDDWRERYGADLVMLMRPLQKGDERCGLAPVGGYRTGGYFDPAIEREFAVSVIGINCSDDVVVAHELGHNMGLTHSHREDETGGTFEFATGYGVDNAFATVMALPAVFNVTARLARFSSPDSLCQGLPCGIREGDPAPADAVQTLNSVRHQIAAYSPRRVPSLPQRNLIASSGRSFLARIAVGASVDDAIDYTEVARPGQRVDVQAQVNPDPAHIGAEGSIHVLIRTRDSGLFQVDEKGRLLSWDGSVDDLKGEFIGPLRASESISILQDFVFDSGAVGQLVEFFVAYEVNGFREVIYTDEPLALSIRGIN